MSNRKNRVFLAFVFTLVPSLTSLSVLGAGPSDKTTMADVKKEVGDAAEAIKDYSAEQRDAALAKTKAALDDLDARIERLEMTVRDRWGQMDQTARNKAAVALTDLKRQRERVAEWYGGLQHSSAENWEQVKRGFSSSYEELKASWGRAEKSLGGGR